MSPTGQTILLVEDNDDDAELTIRAFKRALIPNPVVRVEDGVAALNYLFARESYTNRDINDLPIIVLLDLNLPKISGIEVLTTIRSTEGIKHIPIVILTSSDEEKDRMAAYNQFVNSYIRKPVDYDNFVSIARDLGLYWLTLNRPPPNNP